MAKTSKYFAPAEFTRCTPACSIEKMDQGFLDLMDKVRYTAGIPMVISSAFRSRDWEIAHGRSGDGAHPHGKAVDVKCRTSANRYKIVRAAILCGVRRIGIGKTFIHLDNDPSLPQNVIWDYYDD